MHSDLTIDPKSSARKERIAQLRLQIQACIREQWETSTITNVRLRKRYDELFGETTVRIEGATFELARLNRILELLATKQKRGELIDSKLLAIVREIVDKEFKRYSSADDRIELIGGADSSVKSEIEMPRMYRALVKRLHPDSSGDFTPANKELWEKLQAAYSTHDTRTIRVLYDLLCEEDRTNYRQDESLTRDDEEILLQRLEIQLEAEENKLRRLRSEEPFTLEKPLSDFNWCATNHEELRKTLAGKTLEIERAKAALKSITTGADVAPLADLLKAKESSSFSQQDFFDQAYFNGSMS